MTFVDISTMRAEICMKFYANVKQENIHFTVKLSLKNYMKMTKLCCSSEGILPQFLSITIVVLPVVC